MLLSWIIEYSAPITDVALVSNHFMTPHTLPLSTDSSASEYIERRLSSWARVNVGVTLLSVLELSLEYKVLTDMNNWLLMILIIFTIELPP